MLAHLESRRRRITLRRGRGTTARVGLLRLGSAPRRRATRKSHVEDNERRQLTHRKMIIQITLTLRSAFSLARRRVGAHRDS